jgi:predicted outer membrane protein
MAAGKADTEAAKLARTVSKRVNTCLAGRLA